MNANEPAIHGVQGHPDFPGLKAYLRVRDKRGVELSSRAPGDIRRRALAMRSPCVECFAPIAPFRERSDGAVYGAVTCAVSDNPNCHKGTAAAACMRMLISLIENPGMPPGGQTVLPLIDDVPLREREPDQCGDAECDKRAWSNGWCVLHQRGDVPPGVRADPPPEPDDPVPLSREQSRMGRAATDLGKAALCRSCGASIYWQITKNGKNAPFNPPTLCEPCKGTGVLADDSECSKCEASGTVMISHFATCAHAAEHRRRK